jgi:hypothetical protein
MQFLLGVIVGGGPGVSQLPRLMAGMVTADGLLVFLAAAGSDHRNRSRMVERQFLASGAGVRVREESSLTAHQPCPSKRGNLRWPGIA